VSPARYVGESTFLRLWPPGMLAFAFVVLTEPGTRGAFYAMVFSACGLVSAYCLPWRFEVVDEGIVLRFPFARIRFLPKHAVTIRITPGSVVALRPHRRLGYPLSDGIVERRHVSLRAALLDLGFQVT
jgi:hypothetical protein